MRSVGKNASLTCKTNWKENQTRKREKGLKTGGRCYTVLQIGVLGNGGDDPKFNEATETVANRRLTAGTCRKGGGMNIKKGGKGGRTIRTMP